MSSILDALRKVEADERKRPIRLPPAEPRPRRRLAAVVAGGAFVAGAGVVALVMALRPAAVSEPVLEPGTEVASAPVPAFSPAPAELPPAAPIAPTLPPVAAAPAAPSSLPTIAAQPAAPPVDEDEADADVPDPITILRPAPQPAPQPDPQAEVEVAALPTPTPPQPPIDVLPGPPAGAPDIHVSFLIYSSVPERRQVSLTIDNGPLVTLHEGQKSGSVSLVRILRDRIHVEHGGRTFSVRALL